MSKNNKSSQENRRYVKKNISQKFLLLAKNKRDKNQQIIYFWQ